MCSHDDWSYMDMVEIVSGEWDAPPMEEENCVFFFMAGNH